MEYVILKDEMYEIVDAIEYVTLADSFVKNKIGSGHGEAKLYVGNENSKLSEFFENYKCKCIFIKNDFTDFLEKAKAEYLDPQQEYIKKDLMPNKYKDLKTKLNGVKEEMLLFDIYKVDVEPPRVYINSRSPYYDFMRECALPNISYLSILKLKKIDGTYLYYFKIFMDYKSGLALYVMKSEREQEERITNSTELSEKTRKSLITSRIGQGEFRRKLLEECPICPFTSVTDERILIASHIKPWVDADDKEKVDPKNGFVFTPTYDRLFDKGFITFEDNKILKVSPWISPLNQKRLGICSGKVIDKLPLDDKRKKYLKYHREHVFKK